MPEWPAPGDPPDWELLSSLFSEESSYRHRMGLRRASAKEFYEPTIAGPAIRAEKQAILDRAGERHTLVTPEGHAAAVEFARLLGLPSEVASETNDDVQRTFNQRLGLTLEPDLMLVQPPDWSLVWANVCFPSRWSLEGKLRRPLTWIHDPVPSLNAQLGHKIATFFSRLAPGEGWRRANWGLSVSAIRNQHPDEPIPTLGTATPPDQIFVRVEDQHLLKLPGTGAIAFGIRIANFAWIELMRRPEIAASLRKKLRSMSPDITLYKGLERFIPSIQEKL